MLEKTYQPASIEGPIYRAWEDAGAFAPGRAGAKPFAIVIPPPNVTGSLHIGHALNNTLQDVLVRFERMRGRDVLWQPGTDHAGIATQMVVERRLMERQEPNRRALGREAFIARVWQWKEESGNTIVGQLERLGCSCDWSRLRFTMDEGLSRAVRKVFVDLYRAGLIYKDKRLVNWDPELLTAISDLEVEQIETKGHLWHLRYPIEGRPGEFIVVATTRPETMLGDTAVAVHPDDERYNAVIEPRLTDQWYVDAATLAKPAIDAVKRGRTNFVPKNWETTYFHSMENIQPWCISRQLWWGHQIPAWYGPDGKVFVAEDERQAAALSKEAYGKSVALT